ncbi:MAG: chromosomal replication initiator protein DnaA [Actinomycetota bacterium]|nr:chromosomal replication initiator protein DnaA [Actinomycetota bacterium]
MNDIDEVWTRCADALRAQVSDAIWQAYLAGLTPVELGGDDVVLGVPNTLIRERVESRFSGLIADTVTATVGRPVSVAFTVVAPAASTRPVPDGGDAGPVTAEPDPPVTADVPRQTRPDRRGDRDPSDTSVLNPAYTFETFVIAASNRFPHAASLAVAESPARSYNPLFIYGEAGLGKTHLLHAIGNYVIENFPGSNVRYVSTETFLNEFVDAVRSNSTLAFKRRYRECDVLLIDDIQFIEGREGLQEEFFHTFNSLYGASKQIVLTSDRPPKSIATLEDRLRSRFMSGLMTEVQPPDLETRLAILRAKAERDGVDVPADVLEFIATHVKDNIRVLEGALIRATAYASLNGARLDLPLAEAVLSDLMTASRPKQITPQMILDATADAFGFTVEELKGPNRRRPLVTARQCSMYVFRELTDFSYPAIAKEFGGRDHTTVMHAVEKISNQMKEKHQIFNQVTDLILRIKQEER